MNHIYAKKYRLFLSFFALGFSVYGQEVDMIYLTNRVALENVVLSEERTQLSNNQAINRLKSRGFEEYIVDELNTKQLVGADEWGNPLYYTTFNAHVSERIKANKLYTGGGLGLNLSGLGMLIGQWDYSRPRQNHELLAGKVSYGTDQNQRISRHSTHILGTIIGSDNVRTDARGVAYKANAKAFDWVNDVAEMSAEAARNESTKDYMLVANNSYGYDPLYLSTAAFGKYNTTSKAWDNIMYNAPYFQIVKAAGNARGIKADLLPQLNAKKGYDLLEGAGIAKNTLVVTSVKRSDLQKGYEISDFSSYGPTDDGRIKPDIAAEGEDVYSSIDTYIKGYGTYSGTSSAAAGVTGGIVLLQEYWASLRAKDAGASSTPKYLQSSSIRALLAHTADVLNNKGPNYIYGWGLMNTERAAKLLYSHEKNALIQEKYLDDKEPIFVLKNVKPEGNKQPLVATLAWTDLPGAINTGKADDSSPALINDLDLLVVKKSETGEVLEKYYPWRLGGINDVSSDAKRDRPNNVDTTEKIEIDNPEQNFVYDVIVQHKGKLKYANTDNKQRFSLIVSGGVFCGVEELAILIRDRDNISEHKEKKIYTANAIKASNIVEKGAQGIQYVASNYIELLPDASGGDKVEGFLAEEGSDFIAYIDETLENCEKIGDMLYSAQKIASFSPEIKKPLDSDSSVEDQRVVLYPNPASDRINISYTLDQPSAIDITITNDLGSVVQREQGVNKIPSGTHTYILPTNHLTNGVYFVTFTTNSYKEVKKLIIKH